MKDTLSLFKSKIDETDERAGRFIEIFQEWVLSFPEDVRPVILTMVSHFDYYTHRMSNSALRCLYERLLEETKIEPSAFLYTHIERKDGSINSSIEYMLEYKRINNISSSVFMIEIDRLLDIQWEQIDRIVIIDDICGSGGSLISFIEEHQKDFTNKTIYYLVIHAMEEGIKNIVDYQKKTGITIKVMPINTSVKAFSCPELTEKDRQRISSYSKDLEIKDDYIFGWENSEALVAFWNNTPNNTIGLFWNNTNKYTAPLPRVKRDIPFWNKRSTLKDIKKSRNERKENNYYAKQ